MKIEDFEQSLQLLEKSAAIIKDLVDENNQLREALEQQKEAATQLTKEASPAKEEPVSFGRDTNQRDINTARNATEAFINRTLNLAQ